MSLNSSGFLLTVVFVILKLANVINWSWFWVLSPFIFAYIIAFGVAVFIFIKSKKTLNS